MGARGTIFLGSGGTYHRFEGEVDEFSAFALGTSAPATTVTDASLEETTVETGETATGTEQIGETGSDGDRAGLGTAVAPAALCGATFLRRRDGPA